MIPESVHTGAQPHASVTVVAGVAPANSCSAAGTFGLEKQWVFCSQHGCRYRYGGYFCQRVEPPSVAAATYGQPRDNAFHLGIRGKKRSVRESHELARIIRMIRG